MKTQLRYYFSCLAISVCLLSNNYLISQSANLPIFNNDIEHLLVAEGFQNIEVQNQANQLIIRYENRRYRFEATAIQSILSLLLKEKNGQIDSLVLVPKRRNIPILSIELSLDTYQNFKNGTLSAAELSTNIQIKNQSAFTKNNTLSQLHNPGNFRLELELEPQLRLALGGYPDPMVHQLNLVPRARLYLWTGAAITVGGVLPISNEFEIEEERMVRPEVLTFSQYLRLPDNFYLGLNIGYFTKYRYGSELEIGKFLLNNNLLIKGKIGYTGYASYPKRLFLDRPEKGWQRTNLDYWDYQLGIDYRFSKWDLVAGVEYGKGLYEKKVVQFNLSRQFKETTIRLFAFKTDDGKNYGLQLSIPIFPKKYWKPKTISVRPARQFQYNYNGTQAFITQYQTRNNINDLHFQLNPSFIKKQLVSGL